MSYKVEVLADDSGEWISNALRFSTELEAESYSLDLFRRWTAVRNTRVVHTPDAVNYEWVDGQAKSLIPDSIGT